MYLKARVSRTTPIWCRQSQLGLQNMRSRSYHELCNQIPGFPIGMYYTAKTLIDLWPRTKTTWSTRVRRLERILGIGDDIPIQMMTLYPQYWWYIVYTMRVPGILRLDVMKVQVRIIPSCLEQLGINWYDDDYIVGISSYHCG